MMRRNLQRLTVLALIFQPLVVFMGLASRESLAQENQIAEQADVGSNAAPVTRSIQIRLPITGSSDVRIKRTVDQYLDSLPNTKERPTFVFEFAPPAGAKGSGSQFERCLSLARYLSSNRLSKVRTVAYIPESVTGHAVLVALACEELIVSPDAIFGDAGIDESTLSATIRRGYSEIADNRRTIPAAVALGMLDKDLQVYQVPTSTGVLFVLSSDLDQIRTDRTVVGDVTTVIPAGDYGRFRGDKLREFGFASYLAADRKELAKALKVSVDSLDFDPSQGGQWRAIRLEINGPINAMSVDRTINTIQQQHDVRDVNFVSLQINSPGGSPLDSIRLATYLAGLDQSTIRTVAYVPSEARGDAVLIAFACDHLVVRPNAVIGGSGAATIDDQTIEDMRLPVAEIAQKKSRRWSLPTAMIDPSLAVYAFSKAGEPGKKVYLSDEELAEITGFEAPENVENGAAEIVDEDAVGAVAKDAAEDEVDDKRAAPQREPADWVRGEEITSADKVLQLDGQRAEELGFARFSVDNYDELQQLYQLEETPELIGPNWAFDFIEVLSRPEVAGGLLFIGIFALYIELSAPGIGIGGFVASVCFLLYFWAMFMNGTAEVLEVMLFLAGIAFVLIEIFVVPGFGIFGLGGGGLIFASLILATQTFIIPSNDYQMEQFPRSMLTVFGAFGAVLVSLVLLRKHIHRAPVLGRVMLMPPAGDDMEDRNRRESMVHYDHLIGQIGVATTQLTPSGKAMFGELLVDVVSDGELIAKSSSIRVIEVLGNRVVVEAV